MTRPFRALLLGLLAVLAVAGPARADGELVVSGDGATWASSLPGPVLDENGRWVPGDVRAGSFWVRNDATDAGSLSVAVRAEDPDALLGNADVGIEVRRAGGRWAGLEADGRLHPLADGSLASAASSRIEVRAVFRATSPNRSQTASLRLRFTVALAQDPVVAPPDEDGPGLPDTGGVRGGLVAIGVALMIAGQWLVRRGVRTDKENP